MLKMRDGRRPLAGAVRPLWLALGLVCAGHVLAAEPSAAVVQTPPVVAQSAAAPSAAQISAAQIQQWAYSAQDISLPAVERADALRQLAAYPNQNSLVAVARSLRDEHALVREAAVIAADPYQFA
ncbi:hypothetical protein ACET70_25400, partial [Aeromonas caviae]